MLVDFSHPPYFYFANEVASAKGFPQGTSPTFVLTKYGGSLKSTTTVKQSFYSNTTFYKTRDELPSVTKKVFKTSERKLSEQAVFIS